VRHLKVDRTEADDSEFFYNEKEKRKKSLQIKKSEKSDRKQSMVDGNPFTYKKVKVEKKRHRPKNFKHVKDIEEDED